AIEYLCSRYLQEKEINRNTYLYMQRDDEGHPNCFLSEAVLDAGIPLNFAFQRSQRSYTIADLVSSAKALFSFNATTFPPDDLAWSLIVFAQTTDPQKDGWINAYGDQIHFSDIVEFASANLERATAQ